MHERAQALGIRLLEHQRAAHVGVVGDGDARRRLVGHLREVGALDALLGVVERVEVAGRQGRDRLGADHHPGVLDDAGTSARCRRGRRRARVPTAGSSLAEGELAGGGDLEAHLLLDVGDVDAVALAELAGLEVDVELRDDEQRQALGAGAGALGAGQHEVDDVVDHVGLGGGDEALDAGDVSTCRRRCWMALVRPAPTSEPASGSVSTIVQCQPFSTIQCGELLLLVVAEGVEQLGEASRTRRTCAIAGLAPSTISLTAQRSAGGATVPPSSAGSRWPRSRCRRRP